MVPTPKLQYDTKYVKSLIAHLVRDEHPELSIVDCLEMVKEVRRREISNLIKDCCGYYALVQVRGDYLEKVEGEPSEDVEGKVVGYKITDESGRIYYYLLTPEYLT